MYIFRNNARWSLYTKGGSRLKVVTIHPLLVYSSRTLPSIKLKPWLMDKSLPHRNFLLVDGDYSSLFCRDLTKLDLMSDDDTFCIFFSHTCICPVEGAFFANFLN